MEENALRRAYTMDLPKNHTSNDIYLSKIQNNLFKFQFQNLLGFGYNMQLNMHNECGGVGYAYAARMVMVTILCQIG